MPSKLVFALVAPSIFVLIGWGLYHVRPETGLVWGIGLGLGVVLHRSRFCVAAAYRDTVLFGDTGPAKAVLLTLALSTVGFGLVQYRALSVGSPLPGNVYPISIALIAGALLFGIGIIPAGGCTISAVLRFPEGHLRFLWTLLGMLLGSILGAYHYGWWTALSGARQIHLPTAIGWAGGLAVQGALLGMTYLMIYWWERQSLKQRRPQQEKRPASPM